MYEEHAQDGQVAAVSFHSMPQLFASDREHYVSELPKRVEMNIKDLPKWMNVIPSLIGVALAIIGIYLLPQYGIRNTWGPIIGFPLGMIIGVAILSYIASVRT